MDDRPQVPGITLTSAAAALFGLLLMGVIIQYAEVILLLAFPAEHSLALPAIWVFLLITLLVGGCRLVLRYRLLARAEMLCVLFAMLIAAPLMTQGFWHRIVAIVATFPRAGDFDKLDAFNDNLWPHGPNLLAGTLEAVAEHPPAFQGTHAWETIEYDKGASANLPVLNNAAAGGLATMRLRVPVEAGGQPQLLENEPYLISVLVRARDLGPGARYFCRLYADDKPEPIEVFTSSAGVKITYLHQTGFSRVGAYGVKIPAGASRYVEVEFALEGRGRLELTDPKFVSVGALEGVYRGRPIVSETLYAQLPESKRGGMIVKPDHMLSPAGVAFVLAGYIPVRDWLVPMLAWCLFILLILLGTLAIAVIMRRQWMDNERYVMPMARVPAALADDEGNPNSVVPPIWKNTWMWIGLVIALVWVLMKAAAFYNARMPDPSIRIDLKPYFSDPAWGTMFNTRFEINAIFLAIGAFMELNVLISLVLGFWLFQSQGWVGEFTGWKTNTGYPYPYEQTMAAYLAYGLATLFFTRKYLWRVLRAAATGDRREDHGEAMSYRAAVSLLLLTFVACALWAWWLGLSIGGMLLFFAFLLLVGLVAAKVRTECGVPWGYFAPGNLALFMTLMGGVMAFGPKAMLFCYAASFMLAPTVFFLIPGAQLELLELGRRWNVRSRDLVIACLFGILGGVVIGGWVFLSNGYALGGETVRYDWAFITKGWYFGSYNGQMTEATSQLAGIKASKSAGIPPVWWAYGYAAGGTILLTAMRQLFAGFWFHPLGFVLGFTGGMGAFMAYVWGSLLTAWAIRLIVLKLGGAATVRNKLQPFFIGFFIGAAIAELLIGAHAAYLRSIGVDVVFTVLTPA